MVLKISDIILEENLNFLQDQMPYKTFIYLFIVLAQTNHIYGHTHTLPHKILRKIIRSLPGQGHFQRFDSRQLYFLFFVPDNGSA